MKRFVCIILSSIMLIGLIGCSKVDREQPDVIKEPNSSSARLDEDNDTNDNIPYGYTETMKYFKYFEAEPTETLFMSYSDGNFDDDAMSAFAMSKAISANENFDFKKGVSPTALDEIVTKYFGKNVSSYENKFTTILADGNVVPIGWSPSPYSYVLKEIADTDSGAKIGSFYKIKRSFSETMPYEEAVQKLMEKDFEDFWGTTLVEISFHEKQDENDEYYLEFIYAKNLED